MLHLASLPLSLQIQCCASLIQICSPVQVLFESQGRSGRHKSVDLEDIKFHQCVRLTSFEKDRTISFIPPDGAFDLM